MGQHYVKILGSRRKIDLHPINGFYDQEVSKLYRVSTRTLVYFFPTSVPIGKTSCSSTPDLLQKIMVTFSVGFRKIVENKINIELISTLLEVTFIMNIYIAFYRTIHKK